MSVENHTEKIRIDLERYIEKKMPLLDDLEAGSFVNIKAIRGGVNKIKLAIIAAMRIRERTDCGIMVASIFNDADFVNMTKSLGNDKIIIMRFYDNGIDDPVKRASFSGLIDATRDKNIYFVVINDGVSDKVFKSIGGHSTLEIDLIQFQERLMYDDDFELPPHDEHALRILWDIEEAARERTFNTKINEFKRIRQKTIRR